MNIVLSGFADKECYALSVLLKRRLGARILAEPVREKADMVLFTAPAERMEARWRRLRLRFPDTPMLALGDAPAIEGLDILPRPLKADVLLEHLRQMVLPPQPGKSDKPEPEEAEDFGHYDVHACLAGMLRQAQDLLEREEKAVLVEGPFFLLLRKDGRVISSINPATLHRLAANRSRDLRFTLRTLDERQQADWLQHVAPEVRLLTVDREALIWAVATASSHGELPRELKASAPLYLTSWPDCTHIEQAQNVLPVVACLAQHPCSPRKLVERTGLTRVQVAQVVTALFVAGNVQLQPGQTVSKPAHRPASNLAGMLGKLARHMAGKLFGGQPQHTVA